MLPLLLQETNEQQLNMKMFKKNKFNEYKSIAKLEKQI